MRYAGIIFDLDGVIADTESVQLHAVNLMLEPFGCRLTPTEWAVEYVGHPIEEDVSAIRTRFGIALPVEELNAQRRALYSRLLQEGTDLTPLPGLVRLLDELKARQIPLGIASGSPHADVVTVLRTLGLLDRFGAIATADQVERTKPAPDVYLLAAARLQLQAPQCLAIEDSATGMTAARNAGMPVIGIPSMYTRHHDLRHADRLANGFDEVYQILFGTP